jgi:hypothetical protein
MPQVFILDSLILIQLTHTLLNRCFYYQQLKKNKTVIAKTTKMVAIAAQNRVTASPSVSWFRSNLMKILRHLGPKFGRDEMTLTDLSTAPF